VSRSLELCLRLLILGACLLYLLLNYKEFSTLTQLKGEYLAAIGTAILAFFAATGLTFALLLKLVGLRLTLFETVALSFLTNVINYLAPLRPGAAAKAAYLKLAHKLDYSQFTSVLAANAFITLGTTSSCALMLLFYNALFYGILPLELLLASSGMLLIAVATLLIRNFNFLKPDGDGRVANYLRRALSGFEAIRDNLPGMLLVSASLLLQFLLSGLLMMLVYGAIGIPLSYPVALMLGVFTALANLFTITPNNLGVQEAAMGYLVMVSGGDFDQGVVGAAVLRAMHILLTFGLGGLLVQRLLTGANLKLRQLYPD
jgi:glycosyltransferase 2 family protein